MKYHCRHPPLQRSFSIHKSKHPFKYRPLDDDRNEIRIIHLNHPSRRESHEALLNCTIAHVSLADQPKYKALSYVWGDPTPSYIIRLDNHDFFINESLHLALCRIQNDQSAVTLWVDSICINQDDDVEKSKQVQSMGRIFQEAESAIAWLGPEKDGSDGALAMLADLGEMVLDLTSAIPDASSDMELVNRVWSQSFALLPILAEYALDDISIRPNPLSRLFQRPFWERVWIVQEIAAAKSVVL
ncbi:hypothetical protein BZG36_05217 [Bifiguratus adelaidae]|uniref:Heterokaryon incompatibility domain-containing protein n=1 Tax=Bifiguratus adelaidae TaxID=1938954 RepID=A0A261XWT0_9FUNG|nr:hypothetical protein BZG36_05217 [Bifiguratus adelaidae]